MPRKSVDALQTVAIAGSTPTDRITPPNGLSADVRQCFIDLVNSVAPEHFAPCDASLVVEFCRSVVLARQAAQYLDSEGPVVNGKVNPWVLVQEKAQRSLIALSMRLRISPQGRMSAARVGNMKGPKATGLDWTGHFERTDRDE